MGRIILAAMVGGALVVAIWITLVQLARRKRVQAQARAVAAEAERREAQALAEPGGHPANPIEITSPAVVEPKAANFPCARCGQPVRVTDHQVETVGGVRLRVAEVECTRCGLVRPIFFRLSKPGGQG